MEFLQREESGAQQLSTVGNASVVTASIWTRDILILSRSFLPRYLISTQYRPTG